MEITITTEDGAILRKGDRAYNYYDMEPGTIASDPDKSGWFSFHHDRGGRALLNGARICSIAFAIGRGFRDADSSPLPRCVACGGSGVRCCEFGRDVE